MYDFSKAKVGAPFVCKAKEDKPNELSIFAQVLKNEPENKKMTIARYMRFGQLHYNDVVFDYSTMREYYEAASEDEKEMFEPKHPFYGM